MRHRQLVCGQNIPRPHPTSNPPPKKIFFFLFLLSSQKHIILCPVRERSVFVSNSRSVVRNIVPVWPSEEGVSSHVEEGGGGVVRSARRGRVDRCGRPEEIKAPGTEFGHDLR